MDYRAFAPSPGTPAGIRCLWTLRGDAGPSEPQRVVPDGCVELVFNLAEPFRRLTNDGGGLQPVAMIVAEPMQPVVIAPTGRIDIVAIRFAPGFASAFLGAPIGELGGRSWSLADVRPAHRGMLERIADAPPDARIQAAESLLARSYDATLAPDARIARAAGLIAGRHGRTPIDDIAHLTGVGARALQRGFRRHLGFGPKHFGRLCRFQSLLGGLGGATTGWARLAADHGYYDQSHLIRDFHEFAGASPETFLGEPSAMTELFARSM